MVPIHTRLVRCESAPIVAQAAIRCDFALWLATAGRWSLVARRSNPACSAAIPNLDELCNRETARGASMNPTILFPKAGTGLSDC